MTMNKSGSFKDNNLLIQKVVICLLSFRDFLLKL